MSKRTIIGANVRPVTPGGFSQKKIRRRHLYSDAAAVKSAAISLLESRGIPTHRDAFTTQQQLMRHERSARS